MPKISVIVPVYKAEDYLSACVDSILSQTFSDYEILLVDDGSPDGSGAICDEYAARKENITVLHQQNQGQAAARNHALAKAGGEWICFVDSDDMIHPQTLQLLYEAAVQSGAPISMCGMVEGAEVPASFWEKKEAAFSVVSMEEPSLTQLYDADQYPGWVACAKLIRREIVEDYPFREGQVFEDNEAVCRWICKAGAIAMLPYDFYFYRKNPESTTQAAFSMKKLDYLWALESIIRYYRSIGYEQMRQRFLQRHFQAVIASCNGAQHFLGRREDAKVIEENSRAFWREQGFRLSVQQRELLMDTMHPWMARVYWPVAGAIRTVRSQGLSGVLRKLRKNIRKDEAE